MNRPAFFSTLPFLYEVSCNTWPPVIPDDSGKTRRQILFRDHYLSLEPLGPIDSEGTVGPAYFVPSRQKEDEGDRELFDVAMCKAEMVLFTTPKKTPFQVAPSRRTPSKSPAARAALEAEFKESVAFILIEDRVYQVDLSKLKNVELKAIEAGSNQPPCLLMHYPNCVFRIFSLVGDGTDQYAILNTGKNEIVGMVNGDNCYRPFPMKDSDSLLTSPMGNSSAAHSNSEPGQQEMALQHETARGLLSSEDTTTASSRKSGSSTSKSRDIMAVDMTIEEQAKAKTQKCQTALHAARKDLQSLRRLFKPSSGSRTEELRTTASNLLTSVADNVGASFCTQEELQTAARALDQDMDSTKSELDTLLKAVWPANKRPQKRARGAGNSKSRNLPPLPKDVQDSSIQHVEMLMARHKQELRSKYALAMLPTRG